MNQFGYTLDEALKWTADYHEEVEARFLDGMKRVPSFGPDVDPQLQQFIQAIAMWPRTNDCWNFESGRYFGTRGTEYQRTRCVPLLPKRGAVDLTRCHGAAEVLLVEEFEKGEDAQRAFAVAPLAVAV